MGFNFERMAKLLVNHAYEKEQRKVYEDKYHRPEKPDSEQEVLERHNKAKDLSKVKKATSIEQIGDGEEC